MGEESEVKVLYRHCREYTKGLNKGILEVELIKLCFEMRDSCNNVLDEWGKENDR